MPVEAYSRLNTTGLGKIIVTNLDLSPYNSVAIVKKRHTPNELDVFVVWNDINFIVIPQVFLGNWNDGVL